MTTDMRAVVDAIGKMRRAVEEMPVCSPHDRAPSIGDVSERMIELCRELEQDCANLYLHILEVPRPNRGRGSNRKLSINRARRSRAKGKSNGGTA